MKNVMGHWLWAFEGLFENKWKINLDDFIEKIIIVPL